MSLLLISFWVFVVAVVAGAALAVNYIRFDGKTPPSLPLGAVHGLSALAGLVLLVIALEVGPVRGLLTGSSNFGPVAAIFFIIALAGGLFLLLLRRRRRIPPGLVVAVHAGLAITGFVLLLGYVTLG